MTLLFLPALVPFVHKLADSNRKRKPKQRSYARVDYVWLDEVSVDLSSQAFCSSAVSADAHSVLP